MGNSVYKLPLKNILVTGQCFFICAGTKVWAWEADSQTTCGEKRLQPSSKVILGLEIGGPLTPLQKARPVYTGLLLQIYAHAISNVAS